MKLGSRIKKWILRIWKLEVNEIRDQEQCIQLEIRNRRVYKIGSSIKGAEIEDQETGSEWIKYQEQYRAFIKESDEEKGTMPQMYPYIQCCEAKNGIV
jgi:hypothetical protein